MVAFLFNLVSYVRAVTFSMRQHNSSQALTNWQMDERAHDSLTWKMNVKWQQLICFTFDSDITQSEQLKIAFKVDRKYFRAAF